jgi:hydrogenase maturation factor
MKMSKEDLSIWNIKFVCGPGIPVNFICQVIASSAKDAMEIAEKSRKLILDAAIISVDRTERAWRVPPRKSKGRHKK